MLYCAPYYILHCMRASAGARDIGEASSAWDRDVSDRCLLDVKVCHRHIVLVTMSESRAVHHLSDLEIQRKDLSRLPLRQSLTSNCATHIRRND